MNSIKVERRRLIEVLQKLNIISLGKTTFPVLSTVLIKGGDKKIKFTSTNLELTITSQIEIPSEFNQSFCVSLVKFLSILKEFTSEIVDLRLEKNFLWITCENCEFKLNIISAEEFPSLPILKDKQTIRLNTEVLKEMINLTHFSVFTGEANYVLTGFLWEVEANILKITYGSRNNIKNGHPIIPPLFLLSFSLKSPLKIRIEFPLKGQLKLLLRFPKV